MAKRGYAAIIKKKKIDNNVMRIILKIAIKY